MSCRPRIVVLGSYRRAGDLGGWRNNLLVQAMQKDLLSYYFAQSNLYTQHGLELPTLRSGYIHSDSTDRASQTPPPPRTSLDL